MSADVETIFNEEERETVLDTLRRELQANFTPGERFTLGGYVRDEKLVVWTELADPHREGVHRFEAGHEVDDNSDWNVFDARAHAIEFLHAMWAEYLRDERYPRPHSQWKAYGFRGKDVFFRGDVKNEKLETMADEWLAKAEQGALPDSNP